MYLLLPQLFLPLRRISRAHRHLHGEMPCVACAVVFVRKHLTLLPTCPLSVQAMKSNPKNADVMDAMATFLAEQRGSHDRATELRRQAQNCRDAYGQ